MKHMAIQYVALDVHQATLVVSVRDEQGSIVMRAGPKAGSQLRSSVLMIKLYAL